MISHTIDIAFYNDDFVPFTSTEDAIAYVQNTFNSILSAEQLITLSEGENFTNQNAISVSNEILTENCIRRTIVWPDELTYNNFLERGKDNGIKIILQINSINISESVDLN